MNEANILRLKEVIKEKNITGKELAEKIGLTETSISRIVKGTQYPKFETLINISEVLNVDVRDLIKPTKESKEIPLFIKNSSGETLQVGSLDLENIRAVIDTETKK